MKKLAFVFLLACKVPEAGCGHGIQPAIYRNEFPDAVCYSTGAGISCFPKSPTSHSDASVPGSQGETKAGSESVSDEDCDLPSCSEKYR